jgi:hypothetical protein
MRGMNGTADEQHEYGAQHGESSSSEAKEWQGTTDREWWRQRKHRKH